MAEMEVFNGKREVNINEGETASSISQSRISHKGEKAEKIAKQAAQDYQGKHKGRKTGDDRKVAFFEEPESPGLRGDDYRDDVGSDGKKAIENVDKYLGGTLDDLDTMDDSYGGVTSLAELSKRKSRQDRD